MTEDPISLWLKGPKGIDTTDPAYYTPAWP